METATRENNIAFCAGIFEGEGSVSAGSRAEGRNHIQMVVQMCDREPLQILLETLGGTLRGPLPPRGSGVKDYFIWSISNWREVIGAYEILLPWLSPRRTDQFEKAMLQRPEHPRGQLCCPMEAIPSMKGYLRHKGLGIPPCEICLESRYLYGRIERAKRKGPQSERRDRASFSGPMTLCCPNEPIPSSRGYVHHRKLGIPACSVCKRSHSLYVAQRAKDHRGPRTKS